MGNESIMIITDLDKTLLNSNRQISEYSKQIFKKCQENGNIIVFATARPLRATRILFDSITPNAVICHSGAIIFANEKQILHTGIDKITAKDIYEKIIEFHTKANIAIEYNDEIYTNFDLRQSKLHWNDIPYKKIDFMSIFQENIDKIIIVLESIENNVEQIKNILPKELYLEISDNEVALIMNKEATKWNGIKNLIEYYGIKEENTIAFGDDYIDIEMVEKCGIGIAMENGIEEIKRKAKYICKNNNEDGVAKWIEDNIIKNGQNSI